MRKELDDTEPNYTVVVYGKGDSIKSPKGVFLKLTKSQATATAQRILVDGFSAPMQMTTSKASRSGTAFYPARDVDRTVVMLTSDWLDLHYTSEPSCLI